MKRGAPAVPRHRTPLHDRGYVQVETGLPQNTTTAAVTMTADAMTATTTTAASGRAAEAVERGEGAAEEKVAAAKGEVALGGNGEGQGLVQRYVLEHALTGGDEDAASRVQPLRERRPYQQRQWLIQMGGSGGSRGAV